MASPQDKIARLAAAKLSQSMNPNLPQLVEGVLADPNAKRDAQMYDPATAIGLATLIVSIATFAWTVYKDLEDESKKPDQGLIIRKTRLKFEKTLEISRDDRDRLIEVVVEETVKFKH